MSKHTMYKNLQCDLTMEEIAVYSQELAAITQQQAEIEAEKKEVMSKFTADLNKCIADSRVLARKITLRKEDRQVECDLDFDYARGMVYTIRADTGVTISQRKLSDEERQEKLDFEREEDKQQAIEEQAEASAPVEVAQEPEEEDHEISICGNAECHYHDATEGNGCKQNEYVWECKQAVQEGAVATVPAECTRCHESTNCEKCCETCEDQCNQSQICLLKEAEEEKKQAQEAERDSICHEWRECGYRDVCFTPENIEAGICFKDEPDKLITPASELTFENLMTWGFNRNEAKILTAGFSLVKYDREAKQLSISAEDPRAGWMTLPARETFSAAERDLEKMIEDGLINVAGNIKGTVAGHKCTHKLRAAGFEFYRNGGDRIKFGDSWKTWKKFDDSMDCSAAFETLLTSNPKALED